ncbi:MAG: hypothetical protein V1932_05365 [Chloroflexota bacterium]
MQNTDSLLLRRVTSLPPTSLLQVVLATDGNNAGPKSGVHYIVISPFAITPLIVPLLDNYVDSCPLTAM